jgi:hypothetical protein
MPVTVTEAFFIGAAMGAASITLYLLCSGWL